MPDAGVKDCATWREAVYLADRDPRLTLGHFISALNKQPPAQKAGIAAWMLRIEGDNMHPYVQEQLAEIAKSSPSRLIVMARFFGDNTPAILAKAIEDNAAEYAEAEEPSLARATENTEVKAARAALARAALARAVSIKRTSP
jgi:hypothetical protein